MQCSSDFVEDDYESAEKQADQNINYQTVENNFPDVCHRPESSSEMIADETVQNENIVCGKDMNEPVRHLRPRQIKVIFICRFLKLIPF